MTVHKRVLDQIKHYLRVRDEVREEIRAMQKREGRAEWDLRAVWSGAELPLDTPIYVIGPGGETYLVTMYKKILFVEETGPSNVYFARD